MVKKLEVACASRIDPQNTLASFLKTGSSQNLGIEMADFGEFSDWIGFEKVRKFKERWGDN